MGATSHFSVWWIPQSVEIWRRCFQKRRNWPLPTWDERGPGQRWYWLPKCAPNSRKDLYPGVRWPCYQPSLLEKWWRCAVSVCFEITLYLSSHFSYSAAFRTIAQAGGWVQGQGELQCVVLVVDDDDDVVLRDRKAASSYSKLHAITHRRRDVRWCDEISCHVLWDEMVGYSVQCDVLWSDVMWVRVYVCESDWKCKQVSE